MTAGLGQHLIYCIKAEYGLLIKTGVHLSCARRIMAAYNWFRQNAPGLSMISRHAKSSCQEISKTAMYLKCHVAHG